MREIGPVLIPLRDPAPFPNGRPRPTPPIVFPNPWWRPWRDWVPFWQLAVTAGNTSNLQDQTGANPSWTHNHNGAGAAVVVSWRGGVTVSSVTFDGATMASVVAATNGINSLAQLFVLNNEVTQGNITVQVNFSAAPVQASMGAVSLIGNDTAAALRPGSGVSAIGDSTTQSVTVTVSSVNDLIVGGMAIRGARLPTPEADQTTIYAEGAGNSTAASHEPGTATTETHLYTTASAEAWACVAGSFQPAAVTTERHQTRRILTPVGMH